MKRTFCLTMALAAFCSLYAAAASALPRVPAPKSIYGTDNRQDYFAATPAERKLADSVASLWKDVTVIPEGGAYRLLTENFGEKQNLCPGEPFSEQPLGAFCSGSLVGKDLLMTAGHCIRDDFDCAGAKIVFGFAVTSAGGKAPETVPAGNVYGCKEIVTRALEPKGKDYALIRLDRAVPDRAPLAVSRSRPVEKGDKVFVIGYPVGIPLKVSGGATVRDASRPDFFVADLDTFGGNSGSPVFNAATNAIEGILVRGDDDFAMTPAECITMATYDQNGGRGEDVTKVSLLESFISGKAAGPSEPAGTFQAIDANAVNSGGIEPPKGIQLDFQ